MTGRLIRITTALGVAAVAAIAAVISYRHAYELVSAHGETGLTGVLVSAWPALALAGSFELLMTLIRTGHRITAMPSPLLSPSRLAPANTHDSLAALPGAPGLAQTVLAWHETGRSQRAIARELNIDRRKVKRLLDQACAERST